MAKVLKSLSLKAKAADAAADIDQINQFSVKKLSPEEVYCFSVAMCDNDIDRDLQRFTNKTLEGLAPLFVGKTVISDHSWKSGNQIGRIYDTFVQKTAEQNQAGEPLRQLVGKVYMLNSEDNRPVIDAIEAGILKEVSVGVSVKNRSCSLCGEKMHFDWVSWTMQCENKHVLGETYPEKGLCFMNLDDPHDAYELSFVAVPAQRNAGVTKAAGDPDVDEAFDTLLSCPDLSEHRKFGELLKHMQQSTMQAVDREARKKILEENDKFIKIYEKE
jgi:hypothetical protein